MATITTTTELEAVNAILAAGGDAPVNTLTSTNNMRLSRARNALNEASRYVQGKGCSFNQESDYPLQPDADSLVHIPTAALHVDPSAKSASLDLIERDRKLYDRYNHTFTITETNVYVDIIWLFDYEELPQHARYYIQAMAARIYTERSMSDEALTASARVTEGAAKMEFDRMEARAADTSLAKTRLGKKVLYPESFYPGGYRTSLITRS